MSKKIVSFFNAPVSNVTPEGNLTWGQLYSRILTTPEEIADNETETKARFGGYYTRGVIDGTRNDDNLKKCGVVILDVDTPLPGKKIPSVKKIHKKLKKMGFCYVVHTTATTGRCRIVLPVKRYHKDKSRELTQQVWRLCQSLGLQFELAAESKTRSQPWFFPQCVVGNIFTAKGVEKGGYFNEFLEDKKKEVKEPPLLNIQANKSPLEKFISSLESGTIHQAVKTYAGVLRKSTTDSPQRIFDNISLLVNKHCPEGAKLDRWNNSSELTQMLEWYIKNVEVKYDYVPSDSDELFKQFIKSYKMSDEYLDGLGKEKFLYPNLLIDKQILTIIAKPGGGKTSFFLNEVCGVVAKKGYEVFLLDADSPPSDHKMMQKVANKQGFQILQAHSENGSGIDGQLKFIKSMAENNMDLDKKVFIFDTLKKYVDLMNKRATKEFFTLMRKLTNLGATCVLLAHANKHLEKGTNNLVFEGVGDVISDSDCLIYFEVVNGCKEWVDITTVVDQDRGAKFRGIAEPFSFRVDRIKRKVNLLSQIAVREADLNLKDTLPTEAEVINLAAKLVGEGEMDSKELIKEVRETLRCGLRLIEEAIRGNHAKEGSKHEDRAYLIYRVESNNKKVYFKGRQKFIG